MTQLASMTHDELRAPLIELDHVSKTYPRTGIQALRDVNLSVSEGESVAVVGQSGSGKTTMLNVALGFTRADSGRVMVADPATTGLVFQNPVSSLNPRWTVRRAVAEGLGCDDGERIMQALESVQLDPQEFLDRFVCDMSGGQAQKVALARALVSKPRLIVADEPLSAVDVLGKTMILEVFMALCKSRAVSMLIVTHDIGVAHKLADTIVVMKDGRIVEQGSVKDIVANPHDDYTRALIEAARW